MSVTNDVATIAKEVRALIEKKGIDPGDVASIIRGVGVVVKNASTGKTDVELVDITQAVIEEVAKGQDGISGTDDDLIPATVLSLLKTIAEHDAVRGFAAWAIEELQEKVGRFGCAKALCGFASAVLKP